MSLQKLDHRVKLKNLTLNCSSTTAFRREQQESRFLISKIIKANYNTTFCVGKNWCLPENEYNGKQIVFRLLSLSSHKFFLGVLILFCNEACLLRENLICWRNNWKWKLMKSIFYLTIRPRRLKKRHNRKWKWVKTIFYLTIHPRKLKKQSKVKVNDNYILPDSPSQKIECRGRGLVFSWVDDLKNSTI